MLTVQTRSGSFEPMDVSKIVRRMQHLLKGDLPGVDIAALAEHAVKQFHNKMKTSEIDSVCIRQASLWSLKDTDYLVFAGRLHQSDLEKRAPPSFSQATNLMHNHVNNRTGKRAPLISDDYYKTVMDNASFLDELAESESYEYTRFGLATMERSYFLKDSGTGETFEKPQYLFLRTAVGIHGDDMDAVAETFRLMANGYMTHATPTLFNAGTSKPSLASCYLMSMQEDSIEGIYDTLKQCALISKSAGGIGLSVHNIRSLNSYIAGTNGYSNGLSPMLSVYNNTARYVDQGGGKRKGSFAIYLEPWHADMVDFLNLKRENGEAPDLNYALWIPDLFMRRVQRAIKTGEDVQWSFFSPDIVPGLYDTFGDEFDALYEQAEREGKADHTMPIRKLWDHILLSQLETGMPYMLYKDAANAKSNQQNLGVIRSSNLCAEIVEYTSKDEIAVCNLASIALPAFVRDSEFDFEKLGEVVRIAIRNLNKSIDVMFYPVVEARNSNQRHRPVGLGVQGLHDTFMAMFLDYEGEGAKALNRRIFECIYLHAVKASVELAKEQFWRVVEEKRLLLERNAAKIEVLKRQLETMAVGGTEVERYLATNARTDVKNRSIALQVENASLQSQIDEQIRLAEKGETKRNRYWGAYSTFVGSPAWGSKLQFDLWGETPTYYKAEFEDVKREMRRYGLRNSLLTALMPTASTAQILGNSEGTDPLTSNLYRRRVLSGEHIVINKYMVAKLRELGKWTPELAEQMATDTQEHRRGSVQHLDIPDEVKAVFKTVWEIRNKSVMDLAADRGPFVCQSQSMNVHYREHSFRRLSAGHIYAWKRGLKTGMYYCRSRPVSEAASLVCESCSA